jgi:hypothetical protein
MWQQGQIVYLEATWRRAGFRFVPSFVPKPGTTKDAFRNLLYRGRLRKASRITRRGRDSNPRIGLLPSPI